MGDDNLATQFYDESADLYARATSRVRADADGELASDPGTTPSTITLYSMDMSVGDALVGGILGRFAAQTDTLLIGAGEWGKSYALDGSPAVVLTADGQTYDAVIVAILVSGAVELHAVFGDEAADTAEVDPTNLQIATALRAASITGLDTSAGLVIARFKIQRVATDTITETHVDPADTGAPGVALAQERSAGNIFGVEA